MTTFQIHYFRGNTGDPELDLQHEPNTNPEENLKEPEENAEPVGDPEEALMRTRSGRFVRHRRNKDFDYTGVLIQFKSKQTLAKSYFLDF